MKASKLALLMSTGLVSATLGVGAFAQDVLDSELNFYRDTAQSPGFIGTAARSSTSVRNENPLGSIAQTDSADRQLVIGSNTKYLNVTRGETVKIIMGDKSFIWNFNTLGTPTFNLDQIAPKDMAVGNVRVYVAPRPDELSGG